MTDTHPLAAAIADLEARRASLGDAVVDAAIAALRAQIAAGTPVAAAAPPATATAAAPAPAAPRLRQVSILFADVADSTALLERLSPDEALEVMSGALERFAAIVREAGGEVLRFTGDGLKAAFGAHGVHEDEAERAVRAGLGILEAAEAHAERVRASHGIDRFGMRAGVHSGPVLLGAGVEADRSAIGHAVHLAARMEQSAPVGRLRISHETWALVRGLFRVEPQPPLVVKGHDEPLVTYLVLAANPDPERAPQRGVDGVTPPMIGREAELARLLALFEGVVRSRRPAAACVVAEAGVGKTRLRRELLQALTTVTASTASRSAAEARPPPTTLQARAHPSSALQPYGLMRQLVARWFDIADDLDADSARTRLVEALTSRLAAPEHTPEAAQTRAERLGHLLGLDFGARPGVQALGARELREQGFAALAAALAAEAARAPLVVVLDDLHWADAASLEFVQRLVASEAGAELPVLWLLLTRPEGAAAAPPSAELIRLAPLPAVQGAQLADALLAPLDAPAPALRQLLIARAEGNPFYMEELLRMLVDDGVIDARTRPWRVHAGRLTTLRVPETLVGVLQARLDALPAGELAALQQASIVGPVFWREALAELDAAAPAALPSLRQRAVVVGREQSAFAQADEYAFQHQLLHDVTYGTVLASQRRAGHARAARWLAERIAGRAGEFLAVTAEHFECAGDSAMALEYYDRARRDASARFAHEATLRLIERALAQPALTDARWRFQLLQARSTSLHHQSRDDEGRAAVQAMADFAEAAADDAMRADVATARMLRADHEGRIEEARALALEALDRARSSGDARASGAAALAHGELAWLALQQRDFATVEHHLALGIEQARVCAGLPARAGGYDAYEVQLRVIQIDALERQERHVDCLRAVAEALEALGRRARPLPHDRFHLVQLRCHGELHLGRTDAAALSADELLALAQAMQMPRLEAVALLEQGVVAFRRGDLDAVSALATRSMAIAGAVAFVAVLPTARRLLGQAAALQGDLPTALEHGQQALDALRRQERAPEALQLRCLRAAWLARDEAAAEVDGALADAAADGRAQFRALAPEALLACWQVLARRGDPRAAELAAALRTRLDEQLAQLEAPADADDGARAAAAADRARLIEAVPWWRALGAADAEGRP